MNRDRSHAHLMTSGPRGHCPPLQLAQQCTLQSPTTRKHINTNTQMEWKGKIPKFRMGKQERKNVYREDRWRKKNEVINKDQNKNVQTWKLSQDLTWLQNRFELGLSNEEHNWNIDVIKSFRASWPILVLFWQFIVPGDTMKQLMWAADQIIHVYIRDPCRNTKLKILILRHLSSTAGVLHVPGSRALARGNIGSFPV